MEKSYESNKREIFPIKGESLSYDCNNFITHVEPGYINYHSLSSRITFCSRFNFRADVILATIKFIHIKRNVNDVRREKGAFLKRRLHSAG